MYLERLVDLVRLLSRALSAQGASLQSCQSIWIVHILICRNGHQNRRGGLDVVVLDVSRIDVTIMGGNSVEDGIIELVAQPGAVAEVNTVAEPISDPIQDGLPKWLNVVYLPPSVRIETN